MRGCDTYSPPLKSERTNNNQIQVDFLFENEGSKVYRFEDAGRRVYYVVPSGQVTEVHSESCGKTCIQEIRTQSITTKGKHE